MKRTDLQYRVIDDDNEQLFVGAVSSGGAIFLTTAGVYLTDTEIAQLRDQLTLILETETQP